MTVAKSSTAYVERRGETATMRENDVLAQVVLHSQPSSITQHTILLIRALPIQPSSSPSSSPLPEVPDSESAAAYSDVRITLKMILRINTGLPRRHIRARSPSLRLSVRSISTFLCLGRLTDACHRTRSRAFCERSPRVGLRCAARFRIFLRHVYRTKVSSPLARGVVGSTRIAAVCARYAPRLFSAPTHRIFITACRKPVNFAVANLWSELCQIVSCSAAGVCH